MTGFAARARPFALLGLTVAGLVGGLLLTALGREDLAIWVWAGPTVVIGARLVWSIVRDLIAREAGVDVIAVLAIGGALALGETFAAAVIAVMLATGEALETYAEGRAHRELTALLGRAPQDVNRYRNGGLETVPIGDVRPGDRLLVRPGEVVPVDGVVRGASAILDESALTGESRLVTREDGDPVSSGVVDAGGPFDLLAARGLIDRPIWVARKSGAPLDLRLVAVKKPAPAAEASRRRARREARKGGHQISKGTLVAADWVILVTSLQPDAFPTADVLALYRLRWRIELGFKRLKSVVGLRGPPGTDERSARPYVLAHLLMILLLEPLVDEFEDSPRWAAAA